MALPPGYTAPPLLQLSRYVMDTEGFLAVGRRRFGTPFTARFAGYGTMVFLTDPDAIKEVFTGDPRRLHSGEANEFMAESLGPNSLLVLDDELHARHRRPQVPAFQGSRMKSHAAEMYAATVRRMTAWRPGVQLHMEREFREITLEIILRTVFGVREESAYAALAQETRHYMSLTSHPLALFSTLIPVRLRPLTRWRTILQSMARIDRLLYRHLEERRRRGPSAEREDVLATLLKMAHEDGSPLTDRELRDHLFTMLLAGHDTTAVALGWALDDILRHPDVLARVQDELLTGFPDGEVEAAGVERLPFLDAVIKESLRLHPIVPFVIRLLKSPLTVGGVEYPEGVQLCPCILLVHRDPDLYPEPHEFRPERFLGKTPNSYTWFPFGGGTRRCIGMSYALYEMKVVLATLLRRNALELMGPRPPRVRRKGLLLAPKGEVPVRVVR